MLGDLVEERLKERNLSVRKAAERIGIAHTTLTRVIEGHDVDLSTLVSVCRWLGVNPADVLHAEGQLDPRSELASSIAVLVQASPSLTPVFEEILHKFQDGSISSDTVDDLVRYAAYRLDIDLDGRAKDK